MFSLSSLAFFYQITDLCDMALQLIKIPYSTIATIETVFLKANQPAEKHF